MGIFSGNAGKRETWLGLPRLRRYSRACVQEMVLRTWRCHLCKQNITGTRKAVAVSKNLCLFVLSLNVSTLTLTILHSVAYAQLVETSRRSDTL